MTSLPPLNALAPFEATVRLGSMAQAAEELRLTPSAVSRQIATLEKYVGLPLFSKVGRGIVPAPGAADLAAVISSALESIATATRAYTRNVTDPLVVSCEPTLLQRWLLGRLPEFDQTVPLHLSMGGGPVEFRRGELDAAIRRRDFVIPPYQRVHPLFDEWIGPVCSPGVAEDVRDGRMVALLTTRTRPSAWHDWEKATSVFVRGEPRTFEHFFLTLQAAASGLGVAIGPYPMVEADLASGVLVAPWGFVRDEADYVLLTPTHPHPRTTMLLDWLREQGGTQPPPASRHTRLSPS